MLLDNSHITLYIHRNPYSTPGTNTTLIGSVCARACVHTHAHTHAHIHTHNMHTHTRTHTHTHRVPVPLCPSPWVRVTKQKWFT